MIPKEISQYITEKYGTIRSATSIGGGCIANAHRITCETKSYFIKFGNLPKDMFIKEAHGLQEISASNSIDCPAVIEAHPDFLLLEYIESERPTKDFFTEFGRAFARMHKHTSKTCGFYEDNYIGASPQKNTPSSNWLEFYVENRLVYQLKLMEKQGLHTTELRKSIHTLESYLPDIFADSDDTFSLLHGDLWSGNYMVNSHGKACIIDPAVYYGNREADIAMTKLFGGFTPEFYTAYQKEYLLPEGYSYRENIYLLYHIMNHYTLFGGGYYRQALHIISQYLRA